MNLLHVCIVLLLCALIFGVITGIVSIFWLIATIVVLIVLIATGVLR